MKTLHTAHRFSNFIGRSNILVDWWTIPTSEVKNCSTNDSVTWVKWCLQRENCNYGLVGNRVKKRQGSNTCSQSSVIDLKMVIGNASDILHKWHVSKNFLRAGHLVKKPCGNISTHNHADCYYQSYLHLQQNHGWGNPPCTKEFQEYKLTNPWTLSGNNTTPDSMLPRCLLEHSRRTGSQSTT